jgi:hypothetical protein
MAGTIDDVLKKAAAMEAKDLADEDAANEPV